MFTGVQFAYRRDVLIETVKSSRLSVARIEEAVSVIDLVFRDSPQLMFEPPFAGTRAELILKVETLNPIRSFKRRCACYYVHRLTDLEPLVTTSASNFG